MIFTPDKNQQNIFSTYREDVSKNIVINAGPGAGKTTTILELLKLTPSHKTVLFAAFNKGIVKEIESKVPTQKLKSQVKVKTFHSIGLSSIFQNFRKAKVKIDEYKNYKLFFELSAQNKDKSYWSLDEKRRYFQAYICSELVDTYKRELCSDIKLLPEIGVAFNIDFVSDDLKRAEDLIEYLEFYDREDRFGKVKLVNFVDMIYQPVRFNLGVEQFDVVLVDEAQDLNKPQQKLREMCTKENGRFVAVGDPRQAIYTFLGADSKSFDKFLGYPNTVELPLSISYRMAKTLVDKANTVFDVIEKYEGNPEGRVLEIEKIEMFDYLSKGDYILCRNNAPLFDMYIQCLVNGRKALVRGKDYGNQLYKMIEGVERNDQLKDHFLKMRKELKKYFQEREIDNYKSTHKWLSFVEKEQIIGILMKHYLTIKKLRDSLKDIFIETPDKDALNLMTIHKSKGLESKNVFLIEPQLIPSEYANLGWEKKQEEHLKFVAYTRAKNEFIIVNSELEEK